MKDEIQDTISELKSAMKSDCYLDFPSNETLQNAIDGLKVLIHIYQRLNIHEIISYSEARNQNRLVELPCKVGDTLYEVAGGEIYQFKVDGIYFNGSATEIVCIEEEYGEERKFDMVDLDDKIFFDLSKAERALDELERDNKND